MSKHLQLSIPTPCHENWENMTPVEKGRYCGSCQKQVVDFSRMSDCEIAMFFKKPSTGSVCGRFMGDQLDRDIEIPKKRIPWVKYFFQFALPAFLVSAKASAQEKVKVNSDSVTLICRFKGIEFKRPIVTLGFTTMIKEVIIGRVVDEKNLGIPNATIKILATGARIAADSLGKFQLNVKLSERFLLEVSSVGYETKLIDYSTDHLKSNNEIVICLVPQAQKLDEVVIVNAISTHRAGLVCSSFFTIKNNNTSDPNNHFSNSIKVFPNPVQAGTSLNIEWKQSEEGEYVLQLFNQTGQLTFNKAMWIDKDARVLNLEVPHVAAGSYFLRMTNKHSGNAFTEKIIIQ